MFGAQIDLGDKRVEPRITYYNEEDLAAIMEKYFFNFDGDTGTSGRINAILESISILRNDTTPVIGNISGHSAPQLLLLTPLRFSGC